ncbi:right-handed parallel beta-helix repeat-containing protein [candidate division KSB1 bacterium]|nr:right-handed parallel beta-helix repeat-containing protein [candidate division KSB1 bacterium]
MESTSGKISNSLIQRCHRSGLSAAVGSPTIKDNVIRNTVHEGIQVSSGSPLIEGNTIYNNITGIVIDPSSPIIQNNIIYDNSSRGIESRNTDTIGAIPIIINNTIDNNGANNINCDNSSPIIKNNIIINCTGDAGIRATSGANPINTYNNVWNNSINYWSHGGTSQAGIGSISDDPLFVPDTYNLSENSPCIDAGDPASQLDPDGTRNDMGALFFNQIITIPISLDIKPQSCPNPLNTKSKGVLPVAILGSDELDVSSINPQSVSLAGVSPIRWGIEDVSTPIMERQDECDCTTDGADGFDDLTLKFKTQEIVAAIGSVNNGKEVVLTITAELFDGTLLEGEDCIIVKSKGKKNSKTISPNFESLSVLQNYPNPFNPSTQIEYSIPKSSLVVLKIYNINGQEIRTLVDEFQSPNTYLVSWDGRNDNSESVPSGVYFANILAESFSKTVRLVLVK